MKLTRFGFLAVRLGVLCVSGFLVMLLPVVAEERAADAAPVDFQALRKSERDVDSRIERVDVNAPMEVIGATRGVYLTGTGLIYSMELSLSPAVGISPFFTKPPPEEVEKIRQAKISRVPVLQDLLLSLLPELAVAMHTIPATEELVLGATLFYFPYENLEGLPRQMVVRGNVGALRKLTEANKSAVAGRVAAVSKVTVY